MGNEPVKRIVVFTTYFYPHIGGYEKNVEELFSRISKKPDYEVDVVCFNSENTKSFERRNNLNIYRIDCWNILGGTYALPKIGSLLNVKKKLEKNNYTAVSTQTRFFISSFLGFLFAKKNKAKLIHTERGTSFVKQGGFIVRAISYLVDQTMGRIIISNADVVTGVSQKACDFTKRLGAKEPVKVFNGVDTSVCKKNQKIKKKEEKIVVTFVGRVVEAKGVQDLLIAVSDDEIRDKVFLKIVGSGNHLENLKGLAKKLDIKNIEFLGNKKYLEVINILSGTDVFVNPSYTEGLPTSVIEAGACKCAVIASDVGGTREIVDDNETGFIFKAKDVNRLKKLMVILIKDKKKRETFGNKLSVEIGRRFNWDEIVDQYLMHLNK